MITAHHYLYHVSKTCPLCNNELVTSQPFTACFSQCYNCDFCMIFYDCVDNLSLITSQIGMQLSWKLEIYIQNLANRTILYEDENIQFDLKYIQNPKLITRYLTLLG